MTELEKLLDKIYWHADAQGTAQAQILSAFAEKDKRIAELEKKYEAKAELLRRLEQGDRAIKACKEIAKMEIPE